MGGIRTQHYYGNKVIYIYLKRVTFITMIFCLSPFPLGSQGSVHPKHGFYCLTTPMLFLLLCSGKIKLYCNFSPIQGIARLLQWLKYVLATVAS